MESISKGQKEEESEVCPFCRTIFSKGKEVVEQLQKLIDNGNADACFELSGYYTKYDPSIGLSQDLSKVNELLVKGSKLGCEKSCHNLGALYKNGIGVERDEKKAKHYFELAVINGSVSSRSVIGNIEAKAGNMNRAKRHFLLGARAGDTECLDLVTKGYKDGMITKDVYANTLRAYQKRHDEMKSDHRKKAKQIYP